MRGVSMSKAAILRKLGSRKFWACICGVVISVAALFGVADTTAEQITAIITAFGSLAVYMISESATDVASLNNTTTYTTISKNESKTTSTNMSKDLNASEKG
jgi:hypothetical protein